MPSELNVNKISPASGTEVSLGDSGDTITITSGVTLAGDGSNLTGVAPNKAAVEALGIELPAANLTGTVAAARLGSGTANGTTFLRGDQTYAAAGGGVLKTQIQVETGFTQINSATPVIISGLSQSFTPTESDSLLVFDLSLVSAVNATTSAAYIYCSTDTVRIGVGAAASNRVRFGTHWYGAGVAWCVNASMMAYYAPGAGAKTYQVFCSTQNSINGYVNRSITHGDSALIDNAVHQSSFRITEYANAIASGTGQSNQ